MTDQNKRHVEIILDRSGSMRAIKEDAEGGLREFITKLGEIDMPTTVSLRQFDTEYDTVFENVPLADVPEWHLNPRGATALQDAIGKTITTLGEHLAALPEEQRPGKVIIVIQTDGLENSSVEWSGDQIKELITQQREQWKWEFSFLTTQEEKYAFATARAYGIDRGSTISYTRDNVGRTVALAATATNRFSQGGAFDYTDQEREEVKSEKE